MLSVEKVTYKICSLIKKQSLIYAWTEMMLFHTLQSSLQFCSISFFSGVTPNWVVPKTTELLMSSTGSIPLGNSAGGNVPQSCKCWCCLASVKIFNCCPHI